MTQELGLWQGLEINKKFIVILSIFISPASMLIIALLFLSWFCLYGYGKMTGKDESALEKEIEIDIEKNLENVMNLPSGSLSGKLDFMVESGKDNKNR